MGSKLSFTRAVRVASAVDCGWNTDAAYEALAAGMKDHGSSPEAISRLLITHVHPDHFGMAGRLKRLSDTEIAAYLASL